MFSQIISHTPVFIWFLLAFLIYRGVIALRPRDIEMRKLYIIPVVMLGLSLFDISGKFGFGFAFVIWSVSAFVVLALVLRYAAPSIKPSNTRGQVIVQGSMWPLVLMLGIFVTKYATSVVLVTQPQLYHSTAFVTLVCGVFGIFNGYLLGRLARDITSYHEFSSKDT